MTVDLDARSRAWNAWRESARGLGGTDALLHFDPSPSGTIDLTSGHPGGLAQLLSGRVTKLSSLIREDRALTGALRAMAAIDQNASQLAEERGIDTTAIAVGIASWSAEGVAFAAPILVQPLVARPVPGDFELRLVGRPVVNPALEEAVRESFGLSLDTGAVATLAVSGTVLDPHAAVDHLAQATRGIPGFSVAHRTILATLTDAIDAMAQAMRTVPHPVLDAVARVPGAADELAIQRRNATALSADERPYEQDLTLFDCEEDHDRILAQVAAGESCLVKTVPGGGVTRLIANAVGRLVLAGKRVAVVAAGRDILREVEATLAQAGLSGLAVAPSTLGRDVIAGIVRNERAVAPDEESGREALVRIRSALIGYRDAFLRTNPQFGVRMGQTLNELARLALLPQPPVTRARLDGDALRYVAAHRSEVGELLQKLADLGEFSFGPGTSAWYGAQFDDPDEAKANYVVAKRLHETDLPELLRRSTEIFERVEIAPATTLAEMGDHISMLIGIRDSLDRFVPDVFDRALDEVITATNPEQLGAMSSANRRRLRHLAKEYVRPGMHVSDLHIALGAVNAQRERWNRLALRPKPPVSPTGIGDLRVQYAAVFGDVQQLARVVDQTRLGRLVDLPLDELAGVLRRLTADVDALSDLRERTEIRRVVREHGLEAVVEEFAANGVPAHRVRLELEQAWWQSVFGYMLADEPALLGADTAVLTRLESDFVRLDAEHVETNPARLAAVLRRRWETGIATHPRQAAALKERLKAGTLTPASLAAECPALATTAAPAWLLSPYTFASQLAEGLRFDAVLFADGASIAVPEAVLPIARANQVVVFGDPAIQAPTGFSIPSRPASPAPAPDQDEPEEAPSLFAALSGYLPGFAMTHSYRRGGRAVTDFANRHFYGGRIDALPSADEVAGRAALSFVHVERGNGIPDPETHLVEAVPAEVQAVVELVLQHATWRPHESLMVVSASPAHARRVRAAVREELRSKPHLSSFFASDRREPFVVLTAAQCATRSRDHVIVTVGYGRTPHGRVLSDFGALSAPAGGRDFAAALTRARRTITIVSCFDAADLDPARLGSGAKALAELYREEAADEPAVTAVGGPAGEPLLVDLARRLEELGAEASINYGGALDLVATYGSRRVVIETDNAYGRGTLRETIRLRPELLERLGWEYRRVYTFDLFSDPQRVADEIAIAIGAKQPTMPEPSEPADPAIETSSTGHGRRAVRPGNDGTPVEDPAPFDETGEAWGDPAQDSDAWLLSQRPPHWG